MNTFTTLYLGEPIQLMQTVCGWSACWMHPVMGEFGDGLTYPTQENALTAVTALIQRNAAVDALLALIDEWEADGKLSEAEFSQLEASLLAAVLG